eukprot:SAG31_NODE_22967_length_514_cov_0.862651_1_plen_42_part_01
MQLPADGNHGVVMMSQIDFAHANPRRAWEDMGSPAQPTKAQL